MGLSASQARLLSLTARQSNIEYEGQQINQQRTTLSNESSNYYNSLLEMSVPVPPSTNDYTKIVYTFNIGGNEATIKEALPTKDSEIGDTTYFVSYTTKLSTIGVAENESYKTSASAQKTKGYVNTVDKSETYDQYKSYYLTAINRVNSNDEAAKLREEGTKLYVNTKTLSPAVAVVNPENGHVTNIIGYIMGPDGYAITAEGYNELLDKSKDADAKVSNDAKEALKKCKYMRAENVAQDFNETKYALSYAELPNEATFNAHKDSNDLIKTIEEYDPANEKEGEVPEEGLFSYKSSNQKNYTVVDPQYADAFESAGLDINQYYQYEATSGIRFVKREDVEGNLNNQTRSITTSAVATINKVQENTMSGARIEFDSQGRISTITDSEGVTYTMTATTETDNDAYDDAYNQYEYNQYVYDQRQNEINANIKILQAQDKSLELRLSTLDTQHSAIQTELEAVKKVMSKNIDNSFKTFNA